MKYDEGYIPITIKYLFTSCNCLHGNPTINSCLHVAVVLIKKQIQIIHSQKINPPFIPVTAI